MGEGTDNPLVIGTVSTQCWRPMPDRNPSPRDSDAASIWAAEAVRRAKKYPLQSCAVEGGNRNRRGRGKKQRPAAAFADFLSARPVTTKSGKFGYLRIWSFDVDDDQAFIDAASLLVQDLPDRGLIIDIRNNPGGLIWAAERLLQIFTANMVQAHQICVAHNQHYRRNGESRVQS